MMNQELIEEVKRILTQWDPLGDKKEEVEYLNNYETEAIDIIFQVQMNPTRANLNEITMTVLNQAFKLGLSKQECYKPSKQIKKAINKLGIDDKSMLN